MNFEEFPGPREALQTKEYAETFKNVREEI
jgi:hypothetical protein